MSSPPVAEIPKALRETDQWLVWRLETRNGKPTKVPYDAKTGRQASSTEPATWTTFTQAVAASSRYTGLGFVFTGDDPYFGVDIDDCIDEYGQIHGEARVVIDTLGTYAELSPSGTGVKIFGVGSKPDNRHCRKKNMPWGGEVEVYDFGRFFTVTGTKLHGLPAELTECEEALQGFYREWWPQTARTLRHDAIETVADLADDALLNKALASRQGQKLRALLDGRLDEHDGDASRADSALCTILAFWFQRDAARIDRVFRASGLYREKWDQMRGAQTYGDLTIAGACEICDEVYDPARETMTWAEVIKPAASAASSELRDDVAEAIAGRKRPVGWPFPLVHRMTRALQPATTTLLCGSPGASKSFLLLQCAQHWHDHGERPAVLMLEDTKAFHLRRVAAQRSHTPGFTDYEWLEKHPDDARLVMDEHGAYLDAFADVVETVPLHITPTVDIVAAWVEAKAATGHRIICVDPITLAASSSKPWLDDKELLSKLKKSAEKHGSRLVLVTHPRKNAEGKSVDDLSGGAALGRFAHTVLWLEYRENEAHFPCRDPKLGLTVQVKCNRILHVAKARNGRGQGRKIGFSFCPESLTFVENGVIVKNQQEDTA